MRMLNERDLEGILNKLCKWRTILAGWQLGTRPKRMSWFLQELYKQFTRGIEGGTCNL